MDSKLNEQSTSGQSQNTGADGLASGVKDVASQLAAGAKEVVGKLADGAKEEVEKRVTTGKDAAAGAIGSVAGALRHATEGDEAGPLNGMADRAAGELDRVADYVQSRSIGELLHEVEGFARREPALFLGGTFALGLLGGRFLKSSGSRQSAAREAGYGVQTNYRVTDSRASAALPQSGARTERFSNGNVDRTAVERPGVWANPTKYPHNLSQESPDRLSPPHAHASGGVAAGLGSYSSIKDKTSNEMSHTSSPGTVPSLPGSTSTTPSIPERSAKTADGTPEQTELPDTTPDQNKTPNHDQSKESSKKAENSMSPAKKPDFSSDTTKRSGGPTEDPKKSESWSGQGKKTDGAAQSENGRAPARP